MCFCLWFCGGGGDVVVVMCSLWQACWVCLCVVAIVCTYQNTYCISTYPPPHITFHPPPTPHPRPTTPQQPGAAAPVYDLFAVSNHYGGLGGGHYTAYCRMPDNGRWYCFDDSHVSEISTETVLSSAAYVLFYRRRDQHIKDQGVLLFLLW